MKASKKKIEENIFIPCRPQIAYLMRKWRTKSTTYEKSGSFNLLLYLDYLEAITEQPIKR